MTGVIELRYAAMQCYLQARCEPDPAKRDRLHDVGAILTAEADGRDGEAVRTVTAVPPSQRRRLSP